MNIPTQEKLYYIHSLQEFLKHFSTTQYLYLIRYESVILIHIFQSLFDINKNNS